MIRIRGSRATLQALLQLNIPTDEDEAPPPLAKPEADPNAPPEQPTE